MMPADTREQLPSLARLRRCALARRLLLSVNMERALASPEANATRVLQAGYLYPRSRPGHFISLQHPVIACFHDARSVGGRPRLKLLDIPQHAFTLQQQRQRSAPAGQVNLLSTLSSIIARVSHCYEDRPLPSQADGGDGRYRSV